MGIFSTLLGKKGPNKTQEYLANGAVIIDVRSPAEFEGGHVAGAKNIPLGSIPHKINQIKKMKKPVVLCCASGMRSAQATSQLKAQGIDAVNGGGWKKVDALISASE